MDVPRFEILGVLGAGAQGVVLLAVDHADAVSEPVALKVLRRFQEADLAALDRLRHEARILAWLNHAHIVQVHRLLEKNGLPIVVMEYVQGASALELLAREPGGLPASVAVEIGRSAVLALRAAFDTPGLDGQPLRIVHRDVKPANLLLSSAGVAKVVDFGIATRAVVAADGEGEGTFMGTPGYVAPERRRGATEGTAVDVYALGGTLYAMITGRAPVQTWSLFKHERTLQRMLDLLAPADVEPDVIEDLRGLIQDMCSFDPEKRPSFAVLEERLNAVGDRLGPPDLQAWADANVAPICVERTERLAASRAHVLPDLAFLQEGGDVQDLGVETPRPARGLALRKVDPPTDVAAKLATLEGKRVSPKRLIQALLSLRGTRDARAVSRAYALTEHPDVRVAEAAWELLNAAC